MSQAKKTPAVRWLSAPQEHDYPAAASYLSLIARPERVDDLITKLRSAVSATFKAKDILRAARLPLLGTDNPHVASDLAKIHAATPLSPILIVRGDLAADGRLEIADGYHRVCACYHADENTDIPCLVVDR